MIEKCMTCKGTGQVDGKPCTECDGKGKIKFEYDILKLVGRYRVKPHTDEGTNDFVRNYSGNLNKSFGDFYISCPYGTEIKDALDGELMAYIPSLKRGHNLTSKIIEKYGKDIIHKVEETDGEVLLWFSIKDIDKVGTILKPSKTGASIKPFSTKNLSKGKHTIPQSDLDAYNEIVSVVPTKVMKTKDREIVMPDGLIIKSLVSGFDTVIQKVKGKKFDINADRKLSGLKGKEYISSIGMWDKFLEYLRKEVEQYNGKTT